ncbi:MAG: hypothetical protein PSU93_11600 [Methylobacter sp.]|uniref:Uncharacterized protein n=1 Tax=Candidatus Methylobacter titanis TaxID=3053457 RepID=A0AA43Q4V3_9GAMM|nr:hypothetical protein [Candidatus Methylobacter titanis]
MRKINALLKPHSQRLPLQSVNHKLAQLRQEQSNVQSDAPEYDAVVEKASTEHAALVN